MFKSDNILVTLYSESMYVTCFEFPWERTQSLVGMYFYVDSSLNCLSTLSVHHSVV